MKTKVVVFTSNNARILVNPADLDYWRSREDALIDPDLSAVKAIPPHYWKRGEGGAVLPMDAEERKARDADIAANGADCDTRPPEAKPQIEAEPQRSKAGYYPLAAAFALGLLLGSLVGHYVF